jgi:protoheme IX farnesyltransferase
VTDRAFDGVLASAPGQQTASDIATAADFFALLKPRVMSLVIFTGLVGLVVAPGGIHPVIAFTALLCIAIGAGAAGALNMWYDADIDVGMGRTRERPVPAGRVAPGAALGFGLTLAAGSVVVMGLMVNLIAAALLALTIAFYAVVYTMWLKRRTPQNIVIGGAAGALPPMIGWAAVTGTVSVESFVLFAIIFMWTPPHFWALALKRADEYGRVGVPMLPVVAGPDATRNQILVYSLLLVPITLLPWAMGFAGAFYGVVAAVLGALFLAGAVQVWRVRTEPRAGAWAMRLFSYSILYLFLLFGALLTEHAFGSWA